LEHASSATIVDTVERPASTPGEGRASGLQARLRPLAEPATALVLLALAAAIVHFCLIITEYRNLFVHPDNHQFILKESLKDGLAIGLHDLPNSFQLRAEGESRPRFLTYLFLSIDQKLRLMLYDWMPVHPTLAPVAWLVNLVVAPYCLYRLLLNVTGDRLAGLAGLAVYVSATGFLSGFTMHFMPGKTLSNAMLIVALYAASEAVKRLRPGQLLVEAPGWSKYLALAMVLVGLFLDEMPITTLFVLPLFFWSAFVPRWPWTPFMTHVGTFVKNALFFSIPILAFLVMVLVIMPPLTNYLFGFRFDYLGDTLLAGGHTRTAPSLGAAVSNGLDPEVLLGNLTTLFGLSLAPWLTSPLILTMNGTWPSGQVTNLPKLATLLLFFGVAIFVAMKSTGPFAVHLRGLLVALPIFIVFLSLLMVRHIPVVTGYYYGAIFASLFALLIGLLMTGVSRVVPSARPVAALAVLAIVGVQIVNYRALNDGWRITHDEGLTRDRMAKAQTARDRRIPLAAGQRDLTPGEVQAIWTAWKQNRLDRYLRDNGVSAAAVYEVVELQEIDRARQRRPGQ
jgi:hypothetical protein